MLHIILVISLLPAIHKHNQEKLCSFIPCILLNLKFYYCVRLPCPKPLNQSVLSHPISTGTTFVLLTAITYVPSDTLNLKCTHTQGLKNYVVMLAELQISFAMPTHFKTTLLRTIIAVHIIFISTFYFSR
jgi:hypothetical protein